MKFYKADKPVQAFPAQGDGTETWAEPGMTLRDWFAGMAMSGDLCHGIDSCTDSKLAEWAYRVADAMLKAREEEGQ